MNGSWMRTIAIGSVVVLLAAGAALAEDRNLKPNYDWALEVNGVVDRGWKIFSGAQKTRLFLMSPPGDQAVMVSVSDKSARPADLKLVRQHDGVVDCLAGCLSATKILPVTVSGGTASFALDGRTIVIKAKPALIGQHTVRDLVEDRPSFGDIMKSYQPDAASVSFLKTYAQPVEVEIYFGSWCPVCELWVPRLLKSIEASENERLRVNLFGVASNFSSDQDLAKQKGIRGLPTFIVRQGGIEIGRIVGAPKDGATVEGTLVELLKSKS